MRTRMQVLALTLVLTIAPMLTPAPAAARDYQACLDGCAGEFSGSNVYTVSMRGWCYILRCTGA